MIADGEVPPAVEQVAERSGVSVSSIFRMFDGLDDMRAQAVAEFQVRYAHLLAIDVEPTTPRSRRIELLVRSRVELCAAAGPLLRLARQRAIDHDPIAERVTTHRMMLAEQTRRFLSAETGELTPAEAANLVAVVDATTSPDAFEVLGAGHGRSRRQVERTWIRTVEAIVSDWCGPDENDDDEDDERSELRPTTGDET